jgi:hypothetical protein
MIENHEQLKVTQGQIQRLEYALEQLRQESSKAEFTAQASAVVEHIRRMRAEIDKYLGRACRIISLLKITLQRHLIFSHVRSLIYPYHDDTLFSITRVGSPA